MKKISAVLPLFITVILCISVFSVGVYAFFDEGEKTLPSSSFVSAGASPLKDESLLELFTAQNTDTSYEESSVAAGASPSDAVGKIYEQFISPYKAGLSYNGVYIKNSTGLSVDLKSELATRPDIKIENTAEPQVLIVHTHATESYMNEERDYYTAADKARSTDNEFNVTKVGEVLAQVLREGGIGVLHDRTQHDYPSYSGSYTRSAKTINEYLKKYPSIKIVVDLHRDSISSGENGKCKPTAEIDGKKAAQVMLVVGSETGSVSGFPNWRENFRLAIRFQQTMEALYPGFARPVNFASRKYNMNLTKGSMLLEVGTDSNTLEEACYSAQLAGKALLCVLNTLK